ncbi:enoyl-CoA hydratase/isomerase family protein [Candidatus Kapabacteria bacterium]|nr:enoyl-CoA hydratase/isomerase family protein [Candidatus Kapabacteria bacterium]
MKEAYVNYTIENGIGKIEFFHPRSNSLPGTILQELAETITKAGKDDNVKVIRLSSGGEKAFCAGASFDELSEINEFSIGKKFFMGFANVINAMRKAPKFIVTAVQGKVVGGGVGLVAASDYAIATNGSDMKLSELALGIGPFVVGPAVERKVGLAAFSHMSIDYDWYSADWSKSCGFYTKLFPSFEKLHSEVDTLCEKFANGSLDAMSELKKVIWEGTENWDELLEKRAEISGRLVLSDFTKNYIKEFKSKK